MNKPVAWMDENENVIFEKNWAYPIPLYTHPVKELTQYDRGFDDGCKHTKKIYEAEIEVLKTLLKDESESFDRTASHTAGEYVAYEDEPQAEELHEILQSNAELTDEEIADFLYAYCLDMGDVYEASEAKLIECVRAILRKASE